MPQGLSPVLSQFFPSSLWLSVLSLCVSLPQGSSKDIGQLAAALHHRILALKSRAEQEPETPTTTIPEAEVPRSREDDSDEEDNASASASASTPATSEWFLYLYCFVPNVKVTSVAGFSPFGCLYVPFLYLRNIWREFL